MRTTSLPLLLAAFLPLAALSQEAAPASPPPAPYSVPWQLRPTAALSVVRSDTSIAFGTTPAGDSFTTAASMLLVSYKVLPNLSPLVRLAIVNHDAGTGQDGFAFANPVLGATWALDLATGLRLGVFLGVAFPLGMGGGDTPEVGAQTAVRFGIPARSAMDNAMFAVNDFTVFPGVGLSWAAHGFTAQFEATVLQLTRVRGEAVQPDASKTNFTSGLHLGYFVLPMLSMGAELRYQRWLSTPAAVEANPAARDTMTAAVGARYHLKVGDKQWLRPGLSYSLGLDDPLAAQRYSMLQVDVPFVF